MAQDSAKLVKLPRRTALKQTTLSESVYAEIRSRLQRGEIGPNDRVLDYEVAEEFDCTRMPVRQALLRLVSEGYLIGTTRGFVTPTLTNDDIHEIFEVRRLLEPSAAAGAVAILDDRQDAALKRAFQKAVKAHDKRDAALMIEANMEFRDVWLGAVQNARLQDTIRRFTDHAQQVRLGTLSDGHAEDRGRRHARVARRFPGTRSAQDQDGHAGVHRQRGAAVFRAAGRTRLSGSARRQVGA